MNLGIVTSKEIAQLTAEDRLLAQAFQKQGISATAVVWSDPEIEWNNFDALVIRSCWDYHRKVGEFMHWVGNIEQLRVPISNAPEIVRWNYHKGYLRGLQDQGVTIIPTQWYKAGEQPLLVNVMEENDWPEIILKPSVGATAYKTQKLDSVAAEKHQWDHPYPQGFMVQKFMSEILSAGEWSLVFFGGRYSHGVLKLARDGEFRVQSDFGGTRQLQEPGAGIIAQCEHILECCPGSALYTRIDGIEIRGVFHLMEVELIEPELYMFNDELAHKFVEAFRAGDYYQNFDR
ncbi:MAG: hypothetical protein OER04_18355 [Cyclobacteriaceae bacterium]|nr:hypothetical protein [Cyclobacteriaceae bacterium]